MEWYLLSVAVKQITNLEPWNNTYYLPALKLKPLKKKKKHISLKTIHIISQHCGSEICRWFRGSSDSGCNEVVSQAVVLLSSSRRGFTSKHTHVAADNIFFLMGCYKESLSSLLAVDQRVPSISSHVGVLIGKQTTLCLASISFSKQKSQKGYQDRSHRLFIT